MDASFDENKFKYELISEFKSVSSAVYDSLIQNPNLVVDRHTAVMKRLQIQVDCDQYVKFINRIYEITEITKYRNFSCKFLTNIVYTNDRHFRMKIVTDKSCTCKAVKMIKNH